MAVASLLINEVRDQLQDTVDTPYRWTDATLLRYLTAAQRVVVSFRPAANTIEVLHSIADTVPRRVLPADAVSLATVVSNVSAVGAHRTTPVQRTQINVLDAIDPEWRFAPAVSPDTDRFFSAYAHDPIEPRVFWLYPRPAANTAVYVSYAQNPPVIAAVGSAMTLNDEYNAPCVEYALYRALSSEGRYARPTDHAKAHLDTFATMLKLTAAEYRMLVRATFQRDKSDDA